MLWWHICRKLSKIKRGYSASLLLRGLHAMHCFIKPWKFDLFVSHLRNFWCTINNRCYGTSTWIHINTRRDFFYKSIISLTLGYTWIVGGVYKKHVRNSCFIKNRIIGLILSAVSWQWVFGIPPPPSWGFPSYSVQQNSIKEVNSIIYKSHRLPSAMTQLFRLSHKYTHSSVTIKRFGCVYQ